MGDRQLRFPTGFLMKKHNIRGEHTKLHEIGRKKRGGDSLPLIWVISKLFKSKKLDFFYRLRREAVFFQFFVEGNLIVHAVNKHHAIEMIDFVLDDTRQQA